MSFRDVLHSPWFNSEKNFLHHPNWTIIKQMAAVFLSVNGPLFRTWACIEMYRNTKKNGTVCFTLFHQLVCYFATNQCKNMNEHSYERYECWLEVEQNYKGLWLMHYAKMTLNKGQSLLILLKKNSFAYHFVTNQHRNININSY